MARLPRPKPEHTAALHLRLPPQLLRLVIAECKEKNVTVSEWFRESAKKTLGTVDV